MTDAQTILDMIETVDANDSVKLDEIDARVWCYLRNATILYVQDRQIRYQTKNKHIYEGYRHFGKTTAKYTRSRDALKAIRPDFKNTFLTITKDFDFGWICDIENPDKFQLTTKTLPTEELAELHAIIQAIAYERNRG